MDYPLECQRVPVTETVFDGTLEQPFECDFMLPDYLPDVLRILKCSARSVIMSRTVSGGRCVLEGITVLTVLYLSDSCKGICSAVQKLPFTRTAELPDGTDDGMTEVSSELDFLNCRAVHARRLDIRGGFSHRLRVIRCREEEIITACSDSRTYLRKEEIACTAPAGYALHRFSVRDELPLPDELPSVSTLIDYDLSCLITESGTSEGRVHFKGSALLTLIYTGVENDGAPERFEVSLPISQTVEMKEAKENCEVIITAEDPLTGIEMKPDSKGAMRLCAVNISLCCGICLYDSRTVLPAEDAYSTAWELSMRKKPVRFESLWGKTEGSEELTCEFDMEKLGAQKIVHTSARVLTQKAAPAEGGFRMSGEISFSLFGCTESGGGIYDEKILPYEFLLPAEDADLILRCPEVSADRPMLRVTQDGKAVLKAAAKGSGLLFRCAERETLCELAVSGEKKISADRVPLTLYFAEAGECLFDIAKRYNTSVNAVAEENSLKDDTLTERRMLLIPLIA